MGNCLVCKRSANTQLFEYDSWVRTTCQGCGRFEIPVDALAPLTDHQRPRLSHGIRSRQQGGRFVSIASDMVMRLAEIPLPSAREQIDGVILFVGDRARL